MKDEIGNFEEIIWSYGPTSEFKHKFTVQLLQHLVQKYGKPFTWKFSATSHGKGVVDAVSGNCKSIVCHKTLSKGKDHRIVQIGRVWFC